MIEQEDHTVSIRAEQAVLGSLLIDNDALDRITYLDAAHFYREDHRLIFAELCSQVASGQRADAMTLFDKLTGKVDDCLRYLANLRMSAASAANITRHAEIVADKAAKRALAALSVEMRELAASPTPAASCVDLMASKLELLAQRKMTSEPVAIGSMMVDYLTMMQQRMDGGVKPISTGFAHLDEMLDGGLERGTLTVVAARPGMGKTAFGLGIARNVAHEGCALFLSMEMSSGQVNDRNIAAMGKVPLKWLKKPGDEGHQNEAHWNSLTAAVGKTQAMKLYIDDQTGLNMMEIRAKARKVKRQAGLDLIVVDQLSFITGGLGEKSWETIGQHTRGLIAIGKELDCAILLLCQLNRECEKRADQHPVMSDLAQSGSIEQDAANILFLYREDVAKKLPPEQHTNICEVQSVKQRQGEPGTIGLKYIGYLTAFEDLPYHWTPRQPDQVIGGSRRNRGFE